MKKLILTTIVIYLMAANHFKSVACDACNKKFMAELLSGERANTLAGKELIAAVMNQSPVTPPANAKEEQKVEFLEIIERDKRLPIPQTSYVPQNSKPDKQVTIELSEGEAYLGKGVMFKGFTTNGSIPGPTIIVEEGDIVEFTVVNKGSIPHGASIHAAYTQTSKYLGKIAPLKKKSFLFRVTYPGVYMYHCAPGGHAIPMHVLFGQYGMMVVQPKKKYKLEEMLHKKPDVEIYLLQHEIYASGKDAIEGKPIYTAFNGKLFRYVEEPIKAKPGDYVRINYLNVGPNHTGTFHIVGIIWDYAYWQGNPNVVFPGGQSVIAGPTDSWVVEFRMPPDEGAFLMLDHAVGPTDRGAIGILMCDKNAQTPVTVLSDGPKYSDSEMKEFKTKAVRIVSPFEPGTPDVDVPQVVPANAKEAIIRIMGNSYYPKVLNVAEGTTVKWINEDVFTYMEGEFAGIHDAVSTTGPEKFKSPLLGHAESYSFTFKKQGDYKYQCTPHSYMKGNIIVRKAEAGGEGGSSTFTITVSMLAFLAAIAAWFFKK